jgi:hypothetical protein
MMTHLKTIHEEKHVSEKIIGVVMNYNNDDDSFIDTLFYVYKKGSYIFFNTITDTTDYMFSGLADMNRAYLTESEYDELYDANYIEGKFRDYLEFLS